MENIIHKTYAFRTPSNQKIDVDSGVYSLFREIVTVADLKFLFASKERLYSLESFELGFFNKATKQKEILNHDTKLSDLQIAEYLVIHVDAPNFIKETIDQGIETCVKIKTIVEKAVETVSKDESASDKAVVEVVEKIVETAVANAIEAAVEPTVEKVVETIETIEKVVETVEEIVEEMVEEKIDQVNQAEKANQDEKVNQDEKANQDKKVAENANEEEKVVEKKFCLIC
jgi:hypothetical protein